MSKFILTGLLAFGSLSLAAQQTPDWEPVFKQINDEVQQNSKAYSTLKDATETIGHRLTGSANGKKAEDYTFNLLKSYGFIDVRYQPFDVESWSRGTLAVSVGNSATELQPVKSVSLAHSPVKVDLSAEVVDMGNGLDSEYIAKPGLAKDKIALVYLGILPGTTGRSLHRSEKTAIAVIKYGAKGDHCYQYSRWRHLAARNGLGDRETDPDTCRLYWQGRWHEAEEQLKSAPVIQQDH